MKRIILASSNLGKVREIQEICAGQFEVLAQSDFSVADIEETGLSFVENAIIKARHAAKHTGLPALADDSGLEVEALKGAPGIHSARYAHAKATDAENVQKLLAELAGVPEPQRRARFQCVMVYIEHALDPTPVICQGSWEGRILTEPKGDMGFGYDPVFYVPTHRCSAAELLPAVKNQLSHRAKALRHFLATLKTA
ncbi:MAG TPA: RdgB/HAM1 family non-canonical purine NTP pyrophosphatase [Gammaproteobacteria bacterium]|nr:RdgB/HAM1 family non-canonical purine NTP pyrophosphatase [Gammaproteobacteria bacterium]